MAERYWLAVVQIPTWPSKTNQLPAPGETILRGQFLTNAPRKGANQAAAIWLSQIGAQPAGPFRKKNRLNFSINHLTFNS